jgi:EmrB/QacA subfamily drug resistance transporter
MPTIAGQLGGFSLYSWIFSAYLLTSTTTVPVYGRLADLYGRKPMFIVGAALFVLGSALCGVAQNMPQLVVFRAVQGLGAGGILPVTFTILGDHFGVEERAKMSGLFSAVWGSSAVAGPTVGGFIVDYVDWRWVFYINVPFGAVAIYLMWRHLHETRWPTTQRIDYLGAIVLTVAVSGLLLVLRQIGDGAGWLSASMLALLGGVAVLLIGFVWRERRVPSPVVPLDIFRSRLVAVVTGAGVLIGGVMFGVSSFVPLYVQGVLGRTAVQAGLTVAPFSIGWSCASVVAGRIIIRAGYRVSVLSGAISAAIGAAILLLVTPERGIWPAAAGAACVGIGMGLSSTAMLISVQNSVGWSQRGVATAMVQFARTIGGAVGVAALGTVLARGMSSRLSNADTGGARADALLREGARDRLTPEQFERMRDALNAALHNVYMGMFVLALLALAIIALSFPRGSVADLQSAEGGMGGARPAPQPSRTSDVAATD